MKTKRILSLLLTILMCLSLLPIPAFADGRQVSSWSGLYDALRFGGEIELTADVKWTEGDENLVVPDGVNATLDLNGHIVDRAATVSAPGSVITVNGGLTIKDSAPDAEHDPAVTYTDPFDDEKTITV